MAGQVRHCRVLCAAALCAALAVAPASGSPAARDDFLNAAFVDGAPAPAMLWLTRELQEAARQTLGHPYRALRLRYWEEGARSAWILDEIGKELPITVGVVIAGGRIEQVRILAFRESRGGEVRYPFFTGQFNGAALTPALALDRSIDGITGATLSVRAVTAVARFALALDAAREGGGTRGLALQK